jgi:hypothetical protein
MVEITLVEDTVTGDLVVAPESKAEYDTVMRSLDVKWKGWTIVEEENTWGDITVFSDHEQHLFFSDNSRNGLTEEQKQALRLKWEWWSQSPDGARRKRKKQRT